MFLPKYTETVLETDQRPFRFTLRARAHDHFFHACGVDARGAVGLDLATIAPGERGGGNEGEQYQRVPETHVTSPKIA